MSKSNSRLENLGAILATYWGNHSAVTVQQPVSDTEILAFEEKNRIKLPSDFIQYLAIANGFNQEEGYHDDNGFNFWPLEQLQRVSEYDNGAFAFPESDYYYIFADYLDFSWAYAIRLRSTGGSNDIVIIGTASGDPQRIAESFSEFVDLYVSEDSRLYPN